MIIPRELDKGLFEVGVELSREKVTMESWALITSPL